MGTTALAVTLQRLELACEISDRIVQSAIG
jgi:hypothetical protein